MATQSIGFVTTVTLYLVWLAIVCRYKIPSYVLIPISILFGHMMSYFFRKWFHANIKTIYKEDNDMSEKWKTWLKAALIRAIRTVAQTMAATIGTSALMSEVDWKMVISSGILAGIISILTSLATGLPEVELLHVEDKKQTEETETDVQG